MSTVWIYMCRTLVRGGQKMKGTAHGNGDRRRINGRGRGKEGSKGFESGREREGCPRLRAAAAGVRQQRAEVHGGGRAEGVPAADTAEAGSGLIKCQGRKRETGKREGANKNRQERMRERKRDNERGRRTERSERDEGLRKRGTGRAQHAPARQHRREAMGGEEEKLTQGEGEIRRTPRMLESPGRPPASPCEGEVSEDPRAASSAGPSPRRPIRAVSPIGSAHIWPSAPPVRGIDFRGPAQGALSPIIFDHPSKSDAVLRPESKNDTPNITGQVFIELEEYIITGFGY
ncbi:hypothetical protein FB451DRAFT_1175041 [Mycena latifolia]|nr:hypothetical protein FB451DRAFT_1175041 [Mycena latifolia]